MQKVISTSILMHSTHEKVWNILTQFNNYEQWNPFIKEIKGELSRGGHLFVKIAPPDSKPMSINPQILQLTHQKELRWKG